MAEYINKLPRKNLLYALGHYDKPLMATEMGRPNFDTTNFDPWIWNETVDNQEQIDWVEAAFITQLDIGSRFQGVFLWDLNLKEPCCDVDWDFRGKPLEDAIIFWFSD
jgi:hypothetical protein